MNNNRVFELETSLAGYEIYQTGDLEFQLYGFSKSEAPYKGRWLGEFIMPEIDTIAGFKIPKEAINNGNSFIVSVHNATNAIEV